MPKYRFKTLGDSKVAVLEYKQPVKITTVKLCYQLLQYNTVNYQLLIS